MKKPKLLGLIALGAICIGTIAPAPALGAMPVFDATNYAQNMLQAARALEQINNQVTSLQNEAAMVQGLARNLERIDFPQLTRMTSALKRIDGLMGEAQAIEFEVEGLDERFRTLFPATDGNAASRNGRLTSAKARLEAAMNGFRQSMKVQSGVIDNVREDAELLGELARRSQGTVGSLQAQQAANQLLALGAKQQLQLQELFAAEFRSQSIERARRAQAEAEAQAATRRFLGSGQSRLKRGD